MNNYTPPKNENNIVPTNVMVSCPYIKNTMDISWDDMMPMCSDIIGYNIYRSQVDDQHTQSLVSHDVLTSDNIYSVKDKTFTRINDTPTTTTFYRDMYLNRLVQEDVSDQFRFKTQIDAATDFVGEIVNADYWQAIDIHRLFNQSDGLHFTDVYGGNKQSYFQSNFQIRGNFDIETKYDLYTWPITENIYYSEIAFIVALNEFSYIKISRIRKEATDTYVSVLVVDSTEYDKIEISTLDMSGKFRIIRSSSTISTYYYDGLSWILMNSYLNTFTNDLQIKFYAKSADKQIDVKFYYFHINEGLAFLPELTYVRGEYFIKVSHTPIVNDNLNTTTYFSSYTDKTEDVVVYIDNKLATIKSVDGLAGIITLETERQWDDVLNVWVEPVIPTSSSTVIVSYKYTINSFVANLSRLPYYKVTALLADGSETRLSWCKSACAQSESLDYMYLEAIRRNAWLLDQAGERVLLFIRKSTGQKCECYTRDERTHKQPKIGPCKRCWGTMFVCGYEGPYEIKISPFKSEQKVMMTDRGMKLENIEETWTTISPTITQRDFIVRRRGQIYAIGPISTPDIKGVPTQQHFSVQHVDSTDIRYEFIQSCRLNLFNYRNDVGLRKPFTNFTEDDVIKDGELQKADVIRTDKGPGFNDEKGRSITFENELY